MRTLWWGGSCIGVYLYYVGFPRLKAVWLVWVVLGVWGIWWGLVVWGGVCYGDKESHAVVAWGPDSLSISWLQLARKLSLFHRVECF